MKFSCILILFSKMILKNYIKYQELLIFRNFESFYLFLYNISKNEKISKKRKKKFQKKHVGCQKKKIFFFFEEICFSILMIFSIKYHCKQLKIEFFFIILLVQSKCHNKKMLFFCITEKLKFESTGVDSSRLAQVKLSQLKKTTQSTESRLVSHFDMSIQN